MKFEQLQSAMVQAMKEKNRVKKEVLADIVTCAKNMAIEKGCKDNITEDIVTDAIMKSKKICQEQISQCPANRPDLMEGFQLCMSYIDEFAPKLMTEEEIRKFVSDTLASYENINRGAAMKLIVPLLKGKADNKIVQKVVFEMV